MTIQKVKSVRALDKAPNSKTRRRDTAGFGWFGDGKGLSPGQNYRSSPRRSSRARRHEVKSIKDDVSLQTTQGPGAIRGLFLSIRRWQSHTEPQVGTPEAFPRLGSQAIAVP